MRRKVSFGQVLQVGQLGAELPYQVPTDKESPSSLPFRANSLRPFFSFQLSSVSWEKSKIHKIPLDMY